MRTTIAVLLMLMAWAAFGQVKPPTVEETYMGLSMGPLRHAQLTNLPADILLLAGKVAVTAAHVDGAINAARASLRPALKRNGFYLLEEIGVRALLLDEAKAWAKATKRDTSKERDDALLSAHLQSVGLTATVTDAEVRAFYEISKPMLGGAKYEEVAEELRSYVLARKQKAVQDAHIATLSDRVVVQVNAVWLKTQAATALDNPLDAARRSGKPTLVEFTAPGCGYCVEEAPIIEEARKAFAGRLNVVIVDASVDPVLAARYGIEPVPAQGYFDKAGKEVRFHEGFSPKEQVWAYLAEIGVK